MKARSSRLPSFRRLLDVQRPFQAFQASRCSPLASMTTLGQQSWSSSCRTLLTVLPFCPLHRSGLVALLTRKFATGLAMSCRTMQKLPRPRRGCATICLIIPTCHCVDRQHAPQIEELAVHIKEQSLVHDSKSSILPVCRTLCCLCSPPRFDQVYASNNDQLRGAKCNL